MVAIRATAVTLAIWAGFLALLGLVPWLVPPDPGAPNVAAALGYNIGLAHVLVLGWSVVALAGAALATRAAAGPGAGPGAGPLAGAGPSPVRRWGERALVLVAVLALYWPPALARFGPHVEDSYFLTALWRMACGERPYADFEFLYGPLMIWPAHLWVAAAGTSMTAYYTVLAAAQAVVFLLVLALFQARIASGWRRLAAVVLILPFLADVLLGLNWIALRYLAVVPALLIVTRAPGSWRAALAAGAALGLAAGYSYEYGIAGLLAVLAAQVVALVDAGPGRAGSGRSRPGRGAIALAAVLLVATAVAVWLALVGLTLGADLPRYLASVLTVARAATAQGLGQFAFYWSAHSVALFFLLAAVLAALGAGLRQLGQGRATAGDLMLGGAVVFALVTLKVALQRADYLHLAVPFVPLILIVLIDPPRRLTRLPGIVRTLTVAAIAVAAIGQAAGHLPIGRWVVASQVRGLWHEASGRPTAEPVAARRPGLMAGRSAVPPPVAALAARLADPDLAARPVIFYAGLWDLAPLVGVCPAGYAFYDILYSEAEAPLSGTADRAGLIVAIDAADHAGLVGGPAPVAAPPPRPLDRLVAVLASNHRAQSDREIGYEQAMWKAALGDRLIRDFRVFDRVGDVLLMEHRP